MGFEWEKRTEARFTTCLPHQYPRVIPMEFVLTPMPFFVLLGSLPASDGDKVAADGSTSQAKGWPAYLRDEFDFDV